MMTDPLLQMMADIYPEKLEHKMLCELKKRAVHKIRAMADDELLEQYNYVSELADALRMKHEEEHRKGGNP